MRRAGLVALLLPLAGCLGPGAYDSSARWVEPGLYDTLPETGSRAGFTFSVRVDADSIEHDASVHQAVLGTHALLWVAWAPNRDWTDRLCTASSGAFYVDATPGDGSGAKHGLFHHLQGSPDVDEYALRFADRVVADPEERPRVAERFVREGTFGYDGALAIDGLLASLASSGFHPEPLTPPGGFTRWIVDDWCVLFDVGVKQASRDSYRLQVDPFNHTVFTHSGSRNLDDARLANELNRTFADLGLARPRLQEWTFHHGQSD